MVKRAVEGDGGFSHHYPRVPAVVTCHARGKDNAMTAAWHTSLSFKPPLMGIALFPHRFSCELILESEEFGLNFLSLEKAKLVASVGGCSGRDVDKFGKFHIGKEQALKTTVPILEEAYAAYECKLVDHRTYGDHIWLVGEVVATHFEEGLFTDKGVLDLEQVSPALYLTADLYVTTDRDSLCFLDRKVYGGG